MFKFNFFQANIQGRGRKIGQEAKDNDLFTLIFHYYYYY